MSDFGQSDIFDGSLSLHPSEIETILLDSDVIEDGIDLIIGGYVNLATHPGKPAAPLIDLV